MPTGDPFCQCGCGAWLGQCRRPLERTWHVPASMLDQSAELADLRRQLDVQAAIIRDLKNSVSTKEAHLLSSRANCARLQVELEEARGREGMRGLMADVRSFHEAMDVPVIDTPTVPGADRLRLRAELIAEEAGETERALGVRRLGPSPATCVAKDDCDLVETADGLVDTIYVCCGAGLELGLPLDRVWAEVQAANMRKRGGPINEIGKRLKPPGWVGPDVRRAVFGDAAE